MADIRFFLFCTAFLVLIASTPCRSMFCTEWNVRACSMRDVTFQNYCRFFKSVVTCLEKLLPFCPDNLLKLEMKESLEYHRGLSTKCPGMSAECFKEAQLTCTRDVPINVGMISNYTEESKKTDCKNFKGKEKQVKQCLNGLGKQCTSYVVYDAVAADVKSIEDIEEICANLMESGTK